MATVRRKPACEEFEAPAQGFWWQVLLTYSNRDIVPETVNVLGCSSREGGNAIPFQLPCTTGLPRASEEGELGIQGLLVDLAFDSRGDLILENHPICLHLRQRESFPERLAKAHQKFHRYVMLLRLACGNRNF